MNKSLLIISIFVLAGAIFTGCGWNPSVKAVPISEPWTSMGLPVEKDAVVWASTSTQFKAVHKAGRPEIAAAYIAALTKGGWKNTKKETGAMDDYDFEKGAEKLHLNVYDFEKTGVIIDKK